MNHVKTIKYLFRKLFAPLTTLVNLVIVSTKYSDINSGRNDVTL
jgi:hypothetical protein